MADGLPEMEVSACLDLVEFEYGLPAGLLRPEDSLAKLVKPVSTKNPLRWIIYQVRAGDRENELTFQLVRQMRRHGTYGTWQHVDTIDDLVRAWCGQKPKIS